MSGPIEIVMMSGPFDGQILRLNAPNNRNQDMGIGYIFGRRETCDLSIPYDRWVSSRHARFYLYNNQWYLQDLNSTNHTYIAQRRADGTFSGRERIDVPTPVRAGQLIQLGRVWIRIQRC